MRPPNLSCAPIIRTAAASANITPATSPAATTKSAVVTLSALRLVATFVIILTTKANEIDNPSNDMNAPPIVVDVLLIRAAIADKAPIVAIATVRLTSAVRNSISSIVARRVIDSARIPTAAAISSNASALVLKASALSTLLNWFTAPLTELSKPCTGLNLSTRPPSCLVMVLVILRRKPALKSERTTPQLRPLNVCCIAYIQ